MNKIIAAGVLAATLSAVNVLPANASTIAFPTSGVTDFPQGTFDYKFNFNLNTLSTIDGITGSASSVFDKSPNVSFSSVSISDSSNAQIYTSSAPGPGFLGPGFFLYPDISAGAGSYTLDVRGTVSGGEGKFNGNLTISSIPLPSSVALFGTALLGLGAFGVTRRNKSVRSAA